MSFKFKAVVIDNQNEKFSREIKEIEKNELKDGNVLVKIDYSSLNYKDALILNNGGKIVRKFPFVPGIDFSGKVVENIFIYVQLILFLIRIKSFGCFA